MSILLTIARSPARNATFEAVRCDRRVLPDNAVVPLATLVMCRLLPHSCLQASSLSAGNRLIFDECGISIQVSVYSDLGSQS